MRLNLNKKSPNYFKIINRIELNPDFLVYICKSTLFQLYLLFILYFCLN